MIYFHQNEVLFWENHDFLFPIPLMLCKKNTHELPIFWKTSFQKPCCTLHDKKHFLAPLLCARPRANTNTTAQKRHHREKCAAQGDSIKVVEEECIVRALAHNISEQAKKLLFLRNTLHLRTQCLSNGRLTLRRWLCGLASWLGLTGWLLEWSSGPGVLGPRLRCHFFCCLALGDLRFLLLFLLALLLFIPIVLVGFCTPNRLCCLRLGGSLLLLGGWFPTSRLPLEFVLASTKGF